MLALAHSASASAGTLPRQIGMYAPQSATSLPMLDSNIEVAVRGAIVETTVTQTYKNDSDHATEATYIFPLPVDAAVTAMAIEVGTRKIHAAIERRDQAQQRYEDAIAAGVGAGLLEQERPDVFTQTVSAIPPHGTVAITLRYDATARYADGAWELVLPLVVAPRYVPGAASGRPTTGSGRSPDTDRSHDASRVTPHAAPNAGGKTAISIAFQTAVDAVSSPTHDLHHTQAVYTIEDPRSDRDAIVRWRAKAPASGWVETDSNAGFAAVVVEAPAAPTTRTELAKCTFVIDRAATTRGDGDLVERALVRALLGTMTPKDRVAAAGLPFRAPAEMQKTLDDAWAKPGAAFDLTKTLGGIRGDGAPIVLVTDGLIADDAAAVAAARKTGVPVHVIGFGPAPNRSLLTAIANATGGTIRFAIIGDDLDALARDVVSDVATAPAPLTISWGTLAATDVVPATLPRIGAGQSALVLARVKHAQTANARARGELFALASISSQNPPIGATTAHGALGRRWARLRLDELIAAGNARAITEHALANGLVSPFTAMVAIGDEVVVEGGVKHTKPVPVSVPAGMRWQDVKHETTLDLSTTTQGLPEEQTGGRNDGKIAGKKLDQKKDKDATKRPTKTHDEREDDGEEPRDKARTKHAVDDDEDDKPTKRKHSVAKPPARDRGGDGDATRSTGAAQGGSPQSGPPMPAPPESVATGQSMKYDADGGEDAMVESEVAATSSRRQLLRLSAALGGGVSLVNHSGSALGVVSGRFEVGVANRTLVGVEGSLWVVDGHGAEGTLLTTIARRGFLVPRLELGAGFGIHLGEGTGPALDLVLRIHTPVRHLAVYLRYDGALLYHDATRDGQNTETFGLEAGF